MMKRINFLVDDVGASQLAYYLLTELNRLVRTRNDINPTVFYSSLTDHCIKPIEFNMMMMVEAFDHPGPTVATSLPTAGRLIAMPRPHPKIFYVWDLEWMRYANINWSSVNRLMTHEDLKLIARSTSHKKAIENCFDVEVDAVVQRCAIDDILNFIEGCAKVNYGIHKTTS